MLLIILFAAELRAAATPTLFQALDVAQNGLATISPTRMLTVATQIRRDPSFPVNLYTGLARDPGSGKVFIVGISLFRNESRLGVVDLTTGVIKPIGTISGELVGDLAFDGTGHLYGLTVNNEGNEGTTPHALLLIDKATAAASVVKVLDFHGISSSDDSEFYGALAWNPVDGFLYYAYGGDNGFFVDKIATGTFNQTAAYTMPSPYYPVSMTFAAGKLWLINLFSFSSADPKNLALGFRGEGFITFPTVDGIQYFVAGAMVPAILSCVPSTTTACLYNRFMVEVTYDAKPQNGAGPASVILENQESVKFSFLTPGSIEVVVKILNSCASPAKKWKVLLGGLTNLGVSIKVTDTLNGAIKTYSNPKGRLFQAISDTFNCP